MSDVLLMAHALFGVAGLLTCTWLFVDVLHASAANRVRIRRMSWSLAALMWIVFFAGGTWYVTSYSADKAIILKGPWPFAHNLVMETKEHLVIMLLLLATYLPIVAAENLAANRSARQLMLGVTASVALLALMAEGEGALIAMGVKVGLLSR